MLLAAMTMHLSYVALKKKCGRSPAVEMQTPTCIYIQDLGHVCSDKTYQKVVELKITHLSQVPEEIVVLVRRSRVQI
jgi:hypothetical protein